MFDWLLLLLMVTVHGDDQCAARAKGDQDCTTSPHQTTPPPLHASGGLGWRELDWKEYQQQDLTPADIKSPMERFALNLPVSAGLEPGRAVPDPRDPACRTVQFGAVHSIADWIYSISQFSLLVIDVDALFIRYQQPSGGLSHHHLPLRAALHPPAHAGVRAGAQPASPAGRDPVGRR